MAVITVPPIPLKRLNNRAILTLTLKERDYATNSNEAAIGGKVFEDV